MAHFGKYADDYRGSNGHVHIRDVGGRESYDEDESDESVKDSDAPDWTDAVSENGELFYVQAEESIASVGYIDSKTDDQVLHHSRPATPPLDSKHKKLLKKKRKSSRSRKKDVTVVEENRAGTGNVSRVTFNDVPTGVTRDVTIYVDPHRHNYGRRATQCETLFGIIPGSFNTPSQELNGLHNKKDKRIMVQALLPGGEALRAGVKIGEWLMAINDIEVNFDNIDAILSSISGPRQVKLTVQKIAIQTSPKHSIVRSCVNSSLVKLISGERLHEEPIDVHQLPHCVLYLTLDCNNESVKDKEDVLYQYPKSDMKLVDIRGVFTTLSHMLTDVTNSAAKSSTLLYNNHLVHVGYKKEEQEVMVLAVPASKLSLVQLHHLCDDVHRILNLLFGSLHHAFTEQSHHSRLNHLFTLVFHRALLGEEMLKRGTRQTDFLEPLLEVATSVRALTMPEETKVTINNCLSEFEAADFADMADSFYGLRRAYVVLGSCLFYKGYLLANHLPKEDLTDCVLYLQQYCLLTLCNEEQLGQLVVWREIFPTRRCHQKAQNELGYSEPEARWFLMVLGMRNSLLAVVLEAGGCASCQENATTPDPFYIDQAQATILQLEAMDVFSQCEIRLQGPPMPSLACADWFMPPSKELKNDDPNSVSKVQSSSKPTMMTPAKKVTQPESILKKRSTPSPQVPNQRYPRGPMYDMESDADSQSTGTSEGSTPIMDRRGRKPSAGSDESAESFGNSNLFTGGRRKRNLLSVFEMSDVRRGLSDIDDHESGSFVKLTTGCDNTLFHYVHMDELEGVLLCPTQQEMAQVATPLHTQVLANFHRACLVIKKNFEHSLNVQKLCESGTLPKFGVDSGQSGTLEQGLLFQCIPEGWTDTKKSPSPMTYWAVGRQITTPLRQQFYVCFHDSAQQNMVEMAFKLGFGIVV